MPKSPTTEQRIAWHLEHTANCGCREIPSKLLQEMQLRQITIPSSPQNQQQKELDFKLLYDRNPKVKYGFAKELTVLATQSPQVLYPHLDELIPLLDGENQIMKWTAIDIIGHLVVAEKSGKVENVLPRLFDFLEGGQLITCNHAVFALGRIAMHIPRLRPLILNALLLVDQVQFESEECHEIAVGKVIEVLKDFIPDMIQSPEALAFVQKTCRSKRPATAKKAESLRKKVAEAM
jgi:hypothetical protein